MFQATATALIAFTFMIWSTAGFYNIAIKALYGAAMLWGVFETAKAFGYIVKL